ncbi:MAG: tRNA (N6-threonylcarbamoyladenosine(37)-N6)-methyltransferase TrmO [Bdellovibrionales bacterium]|nr:tRNA (N6-threonylcarbamoyladenosine(37)-N6)-methyltransferase TrmO [Bdellovibrionales bacterium]
MICYQPIGIFKCSNSKPYGAPRQGVLAQSAFGRVQLCSPITKDCVSDLSDFDRIWLIYDFHYNKSWKPKVQPPRGSSVKRSVLATRSPYRPNSIGMSCVKLEKIEELNLIVSQFDLLDETPILDVKPYISYADSFPNAKMGWIDEQNKYDIVFTDNTLPKIHWLNAQLNFDLPQTIQSQLEYAPTCRKSKRVKKYQDSYIFSIQAWRLPFKVKGNKVLITDLFSGYTKAEIDQLADTQWDVPLHIQFTELFR